MIFYLKCAAYKSTYLLTYLLTYLHAAHSGFYENALYKFTFTYLLTYLRGELNCRTFEICS